MLQIKFDSSNFLAHFPGLFYCIPDILPPQKRTPEENGSEIRDALRHSVCVGGGGGGGAGVGNVAFKMLRSGFLTTCETVCVDFGL